MWGFGGPRAARGFDFQASRWVEVFRGRYAPAKTLMGRLDRAGIPNRLSVGEPIAPAVVEVMRRWLGEAEEIVRALASSEPAG